MLRTQELSTDLNIVYQGMSQSDASTPLTSEWNWLSEPGQSTCTTPSSYSRNECEAGRGAPEYGANHFAVTT